MKKILLFFILTVVSVVAIGQQVPQDGSYRIGKLDNGLTYYIRHNAKEAGIADFYIAQRVGSILEEPRQRGLAHFLEHMAFNGTYNFRGDSKSKGIVAWCESVGIKFGTNLNAYTSVDQTVYNISSAPVSREGVLDSTLLILHDWSHYLLLADKEIDKERGVIHEEWRTRRSGMATQRMMENTLPVVYAGTKYADCLPIGSMDIIDNFPYKDLRDYYHKWYRPDLQAVIVVGDIDVDKVESKLKDLFGSIPMPKDAAERIYYPVNDNEKMIVAVEKDAEQPIILAQLYMKRDATPDNEKHTMKYQEDGYIDGIISQMLNGRMQEMLHQPVPPALSASVRSGQFLISRTKDAFSISFGCRQENIKGSFDAVLAETERVRQHGFTQSELERAKSVYLKSAERHYKERNDRRNRYFVGKALQHFLAKEPITTEDFELETVKRFNEKTTLETVNKAVKEIISNRNQVLVVYAPDKPEVKVPSKEEFERYVLEAQSKDYEPYKEVSLAENLISKLPEKGSIVNEKEGMFGTRELVLSNGVKVYVKQTEFSKDEISMRFYAEGGTSLYPDSDSHNFGFISGSVMKAGIGDFDEINLRKMLASKIVNVSPSIGHETQAINGSSSVKDLKTMMELTYLYFTSPRKDNAAFSGEIDRMRSFLNNRDANPSVAYSDSVTAILYGNSKRLEPVKKETLGKVDYDRIMQIYKERFSNASNFKMVLVGNVNMDSLRPLLCQYIASLPSTGKKETFADTYPKVINADETHIFKKKMATPSATVSIFYTFDEPFNVETDMAVDMFARVLRIAYTDSVREEKGGTYGVGVSYDIDRNSRPNTLLKINFRTDPAKYHELIPIIYKQIEHIANKGAEPSSVDKIKKYLLKSYGQNIISNNYWDYVIYNKLRYGIDYHTGYEKLVNDFNPDAIKQVAKDLLKAKRRIEITMIPEND